MQRAVSPDLMGTLESIASPLRGVVAMQTLRRGSDGMRRFAALLAPNSIGSNWGDTRGRR